MEIPVTFDSYGRMHYHPDFHENHGAPWSEDDVNYLIEYYNQIGAEECSLALGRTIQTIMQKACNLRREGLMSTPAKRQNFSRKTKEPTC